ncbi:HET-domain-containing protein [Lepidopterella palustris CBS 459.81]|uniref:HET-domain-containing protein n=1 Tax=Lepidopterella palustris CBS 459.81 TaxID=1314670 RepID=A0A8E2E8F0_9PEZI|nr:HET-domain-containing protein [Lepidopterella palustris CBS 459.81]
MYKTFFARLASRAPDARPKGEGQQHSNSSESFLPQPCHYLPIDKSKQEIRLLQLNPGSGLDPVSCELRVAKLQDDPVYVALSYVWGDETLKRRITMNGTGLEITENLEIALRYCRHKNQKRVLWVDALCINQTDRLEKGHQVGIMGQIYAKADLTYLWLGESADDSDFAMDLLSRLQPDYFKHSTGEEDVRAWRAIPLLLTRPWWSRLWVVQEAFLSRRAVVKCGEKEAGIERFVLVKEFYDGSKRRWRGPSGDGKRAPTNVLSSQHVAIFPFAMCLLFWSILKRGITEGGTDLWVWICLTYPFCCTEPKDKIYALLGLSRIEDQDRIATDYTISENELLKKVTAHALRQHGLVVLQIRPQSPASENPDLPSWVTDWISPLRTTSTLNSLVDNNTVNYADGNQDSRQITWEKIGIVPFPKHDKFYFHISDDLDVLTVTGFVFDVVDFSGPTPYVKPHDGMSYAMDLRVQKERVNVTRRACKEWETHFRNHRYNPYFDKDGHYEAFWRTLIANRLSDVEGPPPERFFISFGLWMGHSYTKRISRTGNDYSYAKGVVTECLNHAFITTKLGYCGLALRSTLPGDLVCVFLGGRVPFILRPIGLDHYKFIGEAYVHGIVQGEAVRRAQPGDARDFTIR